jgi:hypothetical protein
MSIKRRRRLRFRARIRRKKRRSRLKAAGKNPDEVFYSGKYVGDVK